MMLGILFGLFFLLLFIGISQNQNVVFEKRALRKKAAEALAKQQ